MSAHYSPAELTLRSPLLGGQRSPRPQNSPRFLNTPKLGRSRDLRQSIKRRLSASVDSILPISGSSMYQSRQSLSRVILLCLALVVLVLGSSVLFHTRPQALQRLWKQGQPSYSPVDDTYVALHLNTSTQSDSILDAIRPYNTVECFTMTRMCASTYQWPATEADQRTGQVDGNLWVPFDETCKPTTLLQDLRTTLPESNTAPIDMPWLAAFSWVDM